MSPHGSLRRALRRRFACSCSQRRKGRAFGHELQGEAIVAIAQAGGRRAVFEDMALMAAATRAMVLGAWQYKAVVLLGSDRPGHRVPEAGPPGATVELVGRVEHRQEA